ncbi:hypothetical protein ACQZ6F_32055 [Rhizobium sp. A22-96]
MTGHARDPWRHLLGLSLAALAAVAIVIIWEYGLDYLDGTPFEELRYVIFAVVAIGLLSGLNSLTSRFVR